MFTKSLKKILPTQIKIFLKKLDKKVGSIFIKSKIKRLRHLQKVLLSNLRKKEKINIIFLVIHESVWKYDLVYKLFNEDSKFTVKLVVIPLVRRNEADLKTYYQTLNYFKNRKYNVFSSYNEGKSTWIDVNNIIKPDIVFFTNPHNLTFDKYYINNYDNCLTCYVPYSFQVSNLYQLQFNQFFHLKLWKQFYETNRHLKIGQKYSLTKGDNIIVTGYPGVDYYSFDKKNKTNPWKKYNNEKRVKIIWAPHHTIEGQGSNLNYSSFNKYYNYFVELLKNNINIQIAFKPHPLLKEKLYLDKDWGKTKTDKYYKKWDKLPNGQLENGEYKNLFLYSDAMIHDSGSFTAEYLILNKPVMFTVANTEALNNFNSFGKDCIKHHYIGHDYDDIKSFIFDVVIKKQDKLKIERNNFTAQNLLPLNGKTASQNIYKFIKSELN